MKEVSRTSGFTLVELLIVAVVLAIFASIVVAQIKDVDDDANIAAANEIVRTVQRKIDQHRAVTGSWPYELDLAWFQRYA